MHKFRIFKSIFYLACILAVINLDIIAQDKPITGVTFKVTDGRLGDQLVFYCISRWISFSNGFEFLLPANHKFRNLKMLNIYKTLDNKITDSFENKIVLKNNLAISNKVTKNTLYIMDPYYRDNRLKTNITGFPFEEFKSNKKFLEIIKKDISPTVPINKPVIPEDFYSIAIHVRSGSGLDMSLISTQLYTANDLKEVITKKYKGHQDKVHPAKFPPLQYYINCLNSFLEITKEKNIFIYIFTDNKNPKLIMDTIKMHTNISHNKKLIFNCNSGNRSILDDLFSMCDFNCLIRGYSNFSLIPDLIGSHEITIAPKSYKWIGNILHFESQIINNIERYGI